VNQLTIIQNENIRLHKENIALRAELSVLKLGKSGIEQRQIKFKKSLKDYMGSYRVDMLKDFYEYWTEPNPSCTKMRYELEKTWDVKRRLERWARNEKPRKEEVNIAPKLSQSERIVRYYSNYKELLRSGLSHDEAMDSVKDHEYTWVEDRLLRDKITMDNVKGVK